MHQTPWLWLLLIWGAALALAGFVWERFSRPSGVAQTPIVPGTRTPTPRRVLPVWLAFVLLVIVAAALWATVRLLAEAHGATT